MKPVYASIMRNAPPESLGFSTSSLDRAAFLRGNNDAIQTMISADDTGIYAFCGENVILKTAAEGVEALFSAGELAALGRPLETLFLGLEGKAARFAQLIAPDAEADLLANTALKLMGVRTMAMERVISPAMFGALAEGKALAFWHSKHRFCANCGAKTNVSQAGWRRDCDACNTQHFPRTDPVVIMLAVRGDQCLLGRQARFVPNSYSTLAGFVEPGETIEAAVRREIFEEAGITTGAVDIVANQPWPFPESLMIGAICEATSELITMDADELEDCRWFSRAEVLTMINRNHPDGLIIPPRMAIANHLIRMWAEG